MSHVPNGETAVTRPSPFVGSCLGLSLAVRTLYRSYPGIRSRLIEEYDAIAAVYEVDNAGRAPLHPAIAARVKVWIVSEMLARAKDELRVATEPLCPTFGFDCDVDTRQYASSSGRSSRCSCGATSRRDRQGLCVDCNRDHGEDTTILAPATSSDDDETQLIVPASLPLNTEL
jgi:hypothetical protein